MAIPGKPARTVRRARALRREMSSAEVRLWMALRGRPGGFRFRRQHPAGPFVLDFYCAAARLAIEIDGAFHDCGDAPEHDARRDDWLMMFGMGTLRIPAALIFDDLDAAINGIVAAASERLPLHHRAMPGGPPPQAELGED